MSCECKPGYLCIPLSGRGPIYLDGKELYHGKSSELVYQKLLYQSVGVKKCKNKISEVLWQQILVVIVKVKLSP
jgi:hypothetical protein